MRRHGFTLLELAIILAIAASCLTVAAPALIHGRAILAVRAARADVAAAIATTRGLAVLAGGARLVITPAGTLSIERADGLAMAATVDLAGRYGVSVVTPAMNPLTLHYDPLGIGRMTSATVRLERGGVTADIVISAYGRVRL
jgi:type II secretory pathway pseudopilin PulG